MSKAHLEQTEISLLLARLKWPLPGPKWWAMQELADLLANSYYQSQVEELLRSELMNCGFETEVVELLFVFWMAQFRGYVAQPVLPNYVRARSVLSSMLLYEITPEASSKGELSSPLLLAPQGFSPDDDFNAAQGHEVPRIFIHELNRLEEMSRFPFLAQYAFEWARSLVRVPPRGHSIDYFLRGSQDGMTGQFVTQNSHRGRSAYLRTILVAKEFWDMPDSWVTQSSLLALPINPTLASMRSSKPPWLNDLGFPGPVTRESIEAFIRNTIYSCNQRSEIILAALSFPIQFSENEIIDLNLTLWVQWRNVDVDVATLLSEDHSGYDWEILESEGLSNWFTFKAKVIEELCDAAFYSAPVAGSLFRFRYGYLQTDIYSRGWYVPLCTRSAVTAQPSSNKLKFVRDEIDLGETGYWNAGWAPCHPKDCGPFCGTYLILNKKHLPSFWDEPPTNYFYLWECKKIRREQSYREYEIERYKGFIRYNMTNGKS